MADDWVALISQVKAASDIVDVVGSYITLQQAGPTWKGVCPFHDDHRPSLDVDPRRQRYRCWACGKYGDVISFIQEFDRVGFLEALEVLAQRAGISLEKTAQVQANRQRAVMLEVVLWAEKQFQHCFREEQELGKAARDYLGGRKLDGGILQKFGVGFAPPAGDWLVQRARQAKIALETLEQVGLIARRREGKGYYDRFRDRIMFPIRDVRGRTLGFGGRILPTSAFAARAPKYYNSCDTPLFNKSELLYGLDQALPAARKEGSLAVVEGYTDVLMAHQLGLTQVVATMGTALNARHVQHLRRIVPRVILVFDADAGGLTGVDRALEFFVSQNISLLIATLPEGLDPYDVLVQQGAEVFKSALTNAADVLEFKLNQMWQSEGQRDLESRRRAVDSLLRIIALGPASVRQEEQLKRELMITRLAKRFGLKEETLWARLKELQAEKNATRSSEETAPRSISARRVPAATHERELLEVLLAEPKLVAVAASEITASQVEHLGLRQLFEGLGRLLAEGQEPSLDQLRSRLDNPPLIAKALELQERGLANADRSAWLQGILGCFRHKREQSRKQELQTQLHELGTDQAAALELLRQLQNRTGG